METSRFRDQLSDYMENRLSAGERGAIDAHLATSAEARAELAALKSTWEGLENWGKAPGVEAPLFFRDNVMSAIERSGTRRAFWESDKESKLSVWERLFPNAGRLAFAAGLGGVVAIAGYLFTTSALTPESSVRQASTGISAPLVRAASGLILPYAGQVTENNTAEAKPRLIISTGRTLTPDAHSAFDFTFWLENVERGSARFTVIGENTTPGVLPEAGKTFNYAGLSGSNAQTLRLTVDGQKPSALALKVRWTAVGSAHERYLFVPTGPAAITETSVLATPPAFTLAEMPLMDALQQVATITNMPITVEDINDLSTLRARISADGKESVSMALRHDLEPLGLHVSRSPAGILITRSH